ncbi:Uma2 family endonuclease [Ornithinimicrobium sp. F0845]|uniref:Uma2 family endonuclease n=1 Tax=Ornithinimicrobium sp. F0845 TaxID=2926412 RepID=UPI0032B2858F
MTRADLDALRPLEGSERYELLDGSIIVTPGPGRWHQAAVVELTVLLRTHRPEGLVVKTAPFDVALSEDTVLQPDLLVTRAKDLTDKELPTAPLLAVEVLSPSTRRIDLLLKRDRFAAAGVAS